jgi:SAM-dependent methyltransferase
MLDWARGKTEPETLERDDGRTETGAGYDLYVAAVRDWLPAERRALRLVHGRVADVGCGAGRVALHLQEQGHQVVGFDSSPLAVRATRVSGVLDARCVAVDALAADIGSFDTVVLYGNNFGVFGTPARTRRILTTWARRARPGARILAGSTNPYCGGAPGITRDYYFRNIERGRMPGQVRLRLQYGGHVGRWFPWLFVSRREMRILLRGTGWRPSQFIGERSSDPYVAVLEKQPV